MTRSLLRSRIAWSMVSWKRSPMRRSWGAYQHPRTPEIVRRWIGARPDWLDVRQPQLPPSDAMRLLGAGERDAILLAKEMTADVVLMDDMSGRAEASRQRIMTTGTLGVLESAAVRGLF